MKRAHLICLFPFLTATFLLSQSNPVPLVNQSASVASPSIVSQAGPKAQAKILDSYGKLPLSFEANHGQTDGRVKFFSRTSGYSLFLTGDEAVLAMSGKRAKDPAPKGASGFRESARRGKPRLYGTTGGVLRMKLRNANPAANVTGLDELAGTSNYFIGNDPAKWRTNVPTYSKVKYEGIYSGIDLVYYGNQRQLEYDFIVAPGADPHRIAFDVSGAKRIRQDAQGELVLKMGEDEIRWHRPVVYQEKDGARQLVAAHYAITDTNRVGFELAKYDASRPLYIDPLIYSTYLGGSGTDQGDGIAVDSTGNAYITGFTTSTDFPTLNPIQPTNHGGDVNCACDAFVTKIDASGSALVYSTYLGGSGEDYGNGIAVDGAGNAYVIGYTLSTDFPTMNPFQPANGAAPIPIAFVTKLSPTGSALIYSTYLGGSGADGWGIAVDSAGNAYVTGSAGSGFPTTPGAFQTTCCGAFVTKFNPTGSALVYSTYLGSASVEGRGIAVDNVGNAYLTGYTDSKDFPITPGVFQPTYEGSFDAFVTKLNPTGSALVYSSFLGGRGVDIGWGIAVDSAGDAYIAGSTDSKHFPTTPGAFQTTNGSGAELAFVTKVNPTGSALVYSTYYDGGGSGQGIAVDSVGSAYITGPGGGSRFGGAMATRFNATGSAVFSFNDLYGNGVSVGYGIAADGAGNAYVTGWTSATNFPTKNPLQPANAGGYDAFVAKIDMRVKTATTLSSSPNPSTYGQAVTFTAVVTSSLGAPPDGETVTFMKGKTVLGTGTLSGGSASFTTSTLPVTTNYIKAVYGGDSDFLGSTSNTVRQVVSKATTTTTLASSLNPSNFGQAVTFTASVTPEFGGTVTGTVTFYDGTTVLKTESVSGGAAKFTTSTLSSGGHSITATYNGSTSFDGSSATLTQTVN